MSNHYADSIHIVTSAVERTENLRNSIALRGFDRVKCYTLDEVEEALTKSVPDLLILDGEGGMKKALKVVSNLPQPIPTIFLAERFDEEAFLTCHDAGAKDFLVKPVNNAYLISRVLLALEEGRLRHQLTQRDAVLKELSVIGHYSNVFTTDYMIRHLKREVEHHRQHPEASLSLLVTKLDGFDKTLMNSPTFKKSLYEQVAALLKECCRGSDIIGEYFEEKFAMILPNTGLEGGEVVASRVRENLDGCELKVDGRYLKLRAKVGVAEFTACVHYEDLLEKALAALERDSSGLLADPAR